jgi:hypothetical protein
MENDTVLQNAEPLHFKLDDIAVFQKSAQLQPASVADCS